MDTSVKPAESMPDQSVLDVIGGGEERAWWRRPIVWIGIGVLVLVALGVYAWRATQATNNKPTFVTETVRRGDITLSVTANGTLQPTRAVSIGSELSGTVSRVLVDVNDRVKKGQVLVELDTAKLADQVQRSRSSLAAAQARVAQAGATVKESQATLARSEAMAGLPTGPAIALAELDTVRATAQRAMAAEASARADVGSARATLSTDETNFRKASILSPIDGVVLSRSVDPGNAVAASLQAVTLFKIAENLTQLRLEVNVDEADVGAIKAAQNATFTVSAHPGRKFPAAITRVAYGSTITDNVVTYVTYLDVDNSDLSLRPGMTATATITASERSNVLLVPNTALRFAPAVASKSPAGKESGGIVGSLVPRMPGRGGARRSAAEGADTRAVRQVWVSRDGEAAPVAVTLGISDGRMTEITGGELQAGMEVITDQQVSSAR